MRWIQDAELDLIRGGGLLRQLLRLSALYERLILAVDDIVVAIQTGKLRLHLGTSSIERLKLA